MPKALPLKLFIKMTKAQIRRLLRFGVAGFGQAADRFIQAARLMPKVTIAAVADRLKALGLSPEAYFQTEELPSDGFWERIDVLYEAAPNCYRQSYFDAALAHKRDAILEKPPGRSMGEAHAILAKAEGQDELCFTSANHYCFYQPFLILKGLLESGNLQLLGKIEHVEARIFENDDLSHPRYDWLLDPEQSGGGVGVDLGVHPVSRLYALGAETIRVMRAEWNSVLEKPLTRIGPEVRVPETYLGMLMEVMGELFSPDATAWIQVGKCVPAMFLEKSFAVQCERGHVYLDHHRLEVWLDGRLWKRISTRSEAYMNIVAAFLDALEIGCDPNETLAIAVKSLQAVHEAYELLERTCFYPDAAAAVRHFRQPEVRVRV